MPVVVRFTAEQIAAASGKEQLLLVRISKGLKKKSARF